MRQTRIYVPLSPAALRRLAEQGSLGGSDLAAFAVTEQLERAHPGLDAEALEYQALCDAADAAIVLRAQLRDRRVVAAADVEPESVAAPHVAEHRPSQIRVTEAVPLGRVVSFHVDESGSVVEGGAEPDLLWYDATELDTVLDLFR